MLVEPLAKIYAKKADRLTRFAFGESRSLVRANTKARCSFVFEVGGQFSVEISHLSPRALSLQVEKQQADEEESGEDSR